MNRREALKKIVVAFSGILVGDDLMARVLKEEQPVLPPRDGIHTDFARDDFFLSRIEKLYNRIISSNDFNVDQYANKYDIYSLLSVKKPAIKGKMVISRKGNELLVKLRRSGRRNDYSHFLTISETIDSNILVSPQRWTYSSKIAVDMNSAPDYGEPIEGMARIVNNKIVFSDNLGNREVELPSAEFSLLFNLADIVQRIDKHKLPMTFDTIDEYDIVSGIKQMDFYRSVSMDIEGQRLLVNGFIVTGEGTQPIFLWVNDKNNQLLCMNRGMEVFLLS